MEGKKTCQGVLAVDAGTSGAKVGIVDEHGRVTASLYRDTPMRKGSTKGTEHCEETVFCSIISMIQELISTHAISPAQIIGLAVSGQMGGVVGIDERSRSLTGLDAGIDTKSEPMNSRLHEMLGPRLYDVTCGSPRNTPKILWWRETHPEVFRRVRKFIPLSTYTALNMAGLSSHEACIDRSLTAFYGNEDIISGSWSEEITRELDLDINLFPRVASPFQKAGGVSREISMMTGLLEGTPIFVGTGDQSAGLLGAGITREAMTMEVSGSTTLLLSSVGTHIPDYRGRFMYIPSVFSDLLYACSYVNGAGIDLAWFHQIAAKEEDEQEFFHRITREASEVPPGCEGLLFLPYFGGRHCPFQPEDRGGWLGLSWNHGPGHLYRSILEGICYTHALGLQGMTEILNINPPHIHTSGGGSENCLWNQIKADVLGVPIIPIAHTNNTLRGSGLIALHALGCISGFTSETPNCSPQDSQYLPNPSAHEVYAGLSSLFSKLDQLSLRSIQQALFTLKQES